MGSNSEVTHFLYKIGRVLYNSLPEQVQLPGAAKSNRGYSNVID